MLKMVMNEDVYLSLSLYVHGAEYVNDSFWVVAVSLDHGRNEQFHRETHILSVGNISKSSHYES